MCLIHRDLGDSFQCWAGVLGNIKMRRLTESQLLGIRVAQVVETFRYHIGKPTEGLNSLSRLISEIFSLMVCYRKMIMTTKSLFSSS